jgi:PKD repeat protein
MQTNPSYTFAAVGTYPVKLTITTNYGCKDSLVRSIMVHPNPSVGPMLGQTNVLTVSTPYIYTIAQQVNHTYNWIVNNGIIAAGQGTNAATVQWLSNGKGYLKAEITNAQGCKDTTATEVKIGNVGLESYDALKNISIHPNPGNGLFTLSINALKEQDIEVRLLNMLGQEIWSKTEHLNNGTNDVPLQFNVAPGIYQIMIGPQQRTHLQKVVIK